MERDFSAKVTGGLFLGAAVLLWGGWMSLPHRLGAFFETGDFPAIDEHLYLWIWTFRVHLFGLVVAAMALVALATRLDAADVRVLAWPGAAIAAAGLVVGALAAAFYYHHGVWGAVELRGATTEAVRAFVDGLRVDTEYVTCLTRFSRVFTGLGLLTLAAGLAKGRLLPVWVRGGAALLGVAAMALTMGLPDRLELYQPVFHVQSLWLAATGVAVLRSGIASLPQR